MGLMKISTYHKMLGDEVRFVKGVDPNVDAAVWDRIYITTLFTFDFSISVETILHYMRLVDDVSSLYVGGIMASLMPESIVEATGIDRSHILTGLFTDTSVVGDNNDINVDQLPLDYDILEDVNYKYPAGDNYFAYTTRGCPNHCSFCAVPILEPNFHVTNNIVEQIKVIDQKYGPKQHLLLLDNNVLNTPNLESLVDDLCAAGFGRGAKYVDPGTYNIVMMRYHNGDIMARQELAQGRLPDVDYVAGVPDSGVPHAIGYANRSGKPFARPFVKYTPTWPRSFTPDNQEVRNQVAKMKQIPVSELIEGKKLLFVDDSIVRGTQLRETVDFLYESGAKEVHMRSACPPIMYSCKYLNFSRGNSDMELLARRVVQELEGDEGHKHLDEYADASTERGKCLLSSICEKFGFDSLGYQSLDGVLEAIGIDRDKVCTYCWNGKE